jgi:hypothetical protein
MYDGAGLVAICGVSRGGKFKDDIDLPRFTVEGNEMISMIYWACFWDRPHCVTDCQTCKLIQ